MNRTTPDIASRRIDSNRGNIYASNSSLISSESITTPGGTNRKKKPAPQPPTAKELFPSDQRESPILKYNDTLPTYQVRFEIEFSIPIYPDLFKCIMSNLITPISMKFLIYSQVSERRRLLLILFG